MNCDCDQVVYIIHEDVVEGSVKVEKCSTVSKGIKESGGGWQRSIEREREEGENNNIN